MKLKLDMRWSLWDYLADVLSVEGMNGDDAGLGAAGKDGNQTGDERKSGKSKSSKDKDVMNMNGTFDALDVTKPRNIDLTGFLPNSHRRSDARLHSEIPTFIGHLAKKHQLLSMFIPLPS